MTSVDPARVRLREVLADDLDALFAHQQDAEAVRMAAFTSKDPSDRAAFDAHWSRLLAASAIVKRAVLLDGEVVGHVAGFSRDGTAEVTYWIAREWWGRGVATAALRAFLREHRVRPLEARAAADNAASIRVLEKCGFEHAGRDRFFANARGEEIEEVILVLRDESPQSREGEAHQSAHRPSVTFTRECEPGRAIVILGARRPSKR